jgi:alpha-glucosidase
MAAGSEEISVAVQERQERSMLSLYRRLLELRRKHPALHAGIVEDVTAQSGVLSYRRTLGEERFEVLLNMTGEPQQVQSGKGKVVLTTIMDGEGAELGGDIVVEGAEGVLIRLES